MALTFQTGSFKKRMFHIAFYLGFLSRAFMKHRTAGKEGNISLTTLYHFHPLHKDSDIRLAITAESSPLTAHSQLPDSNRKPLASERKSLTA